MTRKSIPGLLRTITTCNQVELGGTTTITMANDAWDFVPKAARFWGDAYSAMVSYSSTKLQRSFPSKK